MARRKAQRGRQRQQAVRQQRFTRAQASVTTWIVQAVIAVVGLIGALSEEILFLMAWCVLASLYALVLVILLSVQARRDDGVIVEPAPAPVPTWLQRSRGFITGVLTLIPTLIGITAALQVIVLGRVGDIGVVVNVFGVWAMLLAWGYLHWGFAQIYEYRAERIRPERAFQFPGTESPTLVDYVYFAFTLGTTFAASDVNVLRTRMRWLVTVHSVLAFFMNALIIALSFNTITTAGAALGALIEQAR